MACSKVLDEQADVLTSEAPKNPRWVSNGENSCGWAHCLFFFFSLETNGDNIHTSLGVPSHTVFGHEVFFFFFSLTKKRDKHKVHLWDWDWLIIFCFCVPCRNKYIVILFYYVCLCYRLALVCWGHSNVSYVVRLSREFLALDMFICYEMYDCTMGLHNRQQSTRRGKKKAVTLAR